MAHLHCVSIEHKSLESHNSLGIGEWYHHPLLETYRKIFPAHPTEDHSLVLTISIKALNDTIGAEGHIPSTLVFGECFLLYNKSDQNQYGPPSMSVLQLPLWFKKWSEILIRMHVNNGLRHAVLSVANNIYQHRNRPLIIISRHTNGVKISSTMNRRVDQTI